MSVTEFDPKTTTLEDAISITTINTDKNPDIYINGVNISEADILAEMQYHPAQDQRSAMIVAAESLIITELFKQRCQTLGLIDSNASLEDQKLTG